MHFFKSSLIKLIFTHFFFENLQNMTSLYESWEDYCSDNSLIENENENENDVNESENNSPSPSTENRNISMDAFIKNQKLRAFYKQADKKNEITIITTKKQTIVTEEDEKKDKEEKNEVKTFLTWGKTEKNSTFLPTFNKKFDSDFPTLSISSFKKKYEEVEILSLPPKQPIIFEEDEDDWINISDKKKIKNTIENSKTRLCKSVLNGLKCVYGDKCQFAHSSNDLNILECAFGKNCKLIISENNQYKNCEDKVCAFLHPNENKDNFIIRNFKQTVIDKVIDCIKNDKPINITIKKNFEKTQLCKSISLKKKCVHGKTCKFAHSIDELNVLNCSFGSKCKLVACKNLIYSNTDKNKICFYKHPNESKDNFMNRNKLS